LGNIGRMGFEVVDLDKPLVNKENVRGILFQNPTSKVDSSEL
jgi:hypothetical protein